MSDEDHVVRFADTATADLVVDAVYVGGTAGNITDDPLARLLPGAGNQGGFRFNGSPARQDIRFAVLYTTGAERDWPDELAPQTGHRQFGVVVTTSFFNSQVYEEVRKDGHPIVMICGRDIADVLRRHGYGDPQAVKAWLDHRFPAA